MMSTNLESAAARRIRAMVDEAWALPEPPSQAVNAHTKEPDDWLPLDLAELAERDPEPPRFIMPGLPAEGGTLVSGHGGAGKSFIELHRAVAIATGRPFFGLATEQRRVLFASCEDAAPILHWRLAHVCRFEGIDLRELAGKLAVLDLTKRDALYFAPQSNGDFVRAPFEKLRRACDAARAELVVIDGISHTFGGNEISRAHVTSYATLTGTLAPAYILVGHVNKANALGTGTTTEGYSGSTAWNNAFRARWYLRRETDLGDDGEPSRTGRLILEAQKGNYSDQGPRLVLTWDTEAHLFAGKPDETAPEGMVGAIRDRTEREAVMAALRGSLAAGVNVPVAQSGNRTAFHVLSARPEFPEPLRLGSAGRRRFWRRIEELRQSGDLKSASARTPDGHFREYFLPGIGESANAKGFGE
jgi:RecA-family ATPase